MKYCVSDIHGNKAAWDDILRKINFSKDDDLYVLGDVIDRNPDGVEILQQIIRTPNMHMLLGNHEYMMLDALGMPWHNENSWVQEKELVWKSYNGGRVTWYSFKELPENDKEEILNFLSNLPLNIEVEANNKKFLLCHAAPEFAYDMMANVEPIGEEKGYFCVWERNAIKFFMADGIYNGTIIFGHTPTVNLGANADKPEILKFMNGDAVSYAIDCGAGYPNGRRFNGRLGCLCLDTLEEFYSE